MAETYDVAIIGGGFSGTMVAVNLSRLSQGRLRIALIEGKSKHGPGLAYGTKDAEHLLNVRAGGMGAFADNPGHFHEWLMRQPGALAATTPDTFMPRLVYGQYLREVLEQARTLQGGIDLLNARITGVEPTGNSYDLMDASGLVARARKIVLALGNFPPMDQWLDPYAPGIATRLCGPGDVFLVGTGLTALDMLVTMARDKPSGKIHLLSRSGLFPQVHMPLKAYPVFLDPDQLPRSAFELLTMIRREVRNAAQAGIGWQDVIDTMRPLNQRIWQALPLPEQKRFLKRVRSFWDTHRHRSAPEVMAAKNTLEDQQRLVQHKGSFVSAMVDGERVGVTWQPSHGERQTIVVECAVACTGPQTDLQKVDDPLIRNLLGQGLILPDPLRLGMDTGPDGEVLGRDGKPTPGLYTIGTWRKGRLYESVAVPELRGQAADLASALMVTT
jgi:uncharacterized NAD(P)/FAD-binding protein YdhS